MYTQEQTDILAAVFNSMPRRDVMPADQIEIAMEQWRTMALAVAEAIMVHTTGATQKHVAWLRSNMQEVAQ